MFSFHKYYNSNAHRFYFPVRLCPDNPLGRKPDFSEKTDEKFLKKFYFVARLY